MVNGVGPGPERCVHLPDGPLACVCGYLSDQRIPDRARLLGRGRRVRSIEIIYAPQATQTTSKGNAQVTGGGRMECLERMGRGGEGGEEEEMDVTWIT